MSWIKLGQDVDGVENGGRFGRAVSIAADGATIAVGIPSADTNGTSAGQVRVFKYNNSTWVQHGNSINGLATQNEFGYSVSISNDGSVVAIGAPYAGASGSGQVSVYKFITDTWVQQGVAIDGEIVNENFGVSVSLSSDGTTVVIGGTNVATSATNNTRGIVRIYKFINDAWVQQGMTINGEGPIDRSGTSVSISNDGSVVAIGAPLASGSLINAGHVRVYKLINGTWAQQGADIDGEAVGDQSGTSVSLSGDGSTVAIGAVINNENGIWSGHVRIYKFINGTWTQQGADINGEAAYDQSGFSVSISNDGSVVAIGALLNDADGTATDAGHVRVYKLINGTWIQQGLDIDGEAADDQAGRVSLSEDGTTVAIGSINNSGTGHVRVYKFFTGHQNQLGQDIGIEAGVEQFIRAISLSADGSTVAIGAADRAYTNVSSRVRVYKLIGGTWAQQGLDINGEATEDNFGDSISISSDGTTVAIGAAANDGNGASSGHVRIYKFINGTWIKQGADIDGEAAGDLAGWAVSLSADGTTVAIGAPYNDGNGNNVGHVRVYKLINGTWIQQGADIEGATPSIGFGSSVSLSANGTTVAIGAPAPIFDDYGNLTAGQYVSVYKLIGGNWAKQGLDINSEGGEDGTGHSVSLSANGETVAIGAPFTSVNGMQSGQVRVYTFINDNWVKKGEDIDGEAVANEFGYHVSLSADGNTVAVNVAIYESSLFGAGGARIYTFINGTWAKQGDDYLPKSGDTGFGEHVTLSANGSTVAIGGYSNTLDGFVRVYTYTKYFTPVSNETVVIERNASTSTNNISIAIRYNSSIQGEDINANIERIECMLQRRYTELTTWETLSSFTLLQNAAGDWVTSTNLIQPLGGKARIVYTIVPVANSSYLATTFVSDPFALGPFECDVSIFGVNTIRITPTNPVTGKVYAHNISVFNGNAQPISLTSTVPGFAYNAETSTGVVPAAYCSNPYSIGGISFTTSNQYNIQIMTQVTGRDIKYRYITSLLIPSTLQSITTLSGVTGLSLNTITSLATNDPTLVPALSGITNGLLNSTLSASTPQPDGSAKTSVDASLKLVARAQAAANPTAPITAMTIPNANLRYINSAGLYGRTAIVVAAVPPSNAGSARNCVLTSGQESAIRNGLFYIAGETGESLRLVSQDGLRSILFEFPGSGQVRVDNQTRTIGETVRTQMGSIILNFSGSVGGAGVADAVCFLADAPVLTPTGYRPIHTMQVGDMVRTAAGRDVVVKRTFAKEYSPSAAANPFVIPKGMFGALRALPISPNHEVMVAGKGMMKAKNLGLPRMKMTGSFTYYNLELEDWVRDNLVVAGVECESLAPAERIVMSKAEFLRFVKARYGASSTTRLRSVCFEESDGRISLPALR